jgi:hypothetical protein
MDPEIEYLELALDSTDATAAAGEVWRNTSSPANQLIYTWPKFYWAQKSPDIIAMKVLSAEIPNVFDTIATGQNTFVVTVSAVPTTFTIPPGIYSGATLASALTTLLTAYPITVTYDSTTLRFSFVYALANPWSIAFASKATAYSQLGFLPSSTVSLPGAGTIVSPVVANVTGAYYLYLNSRILGPLINFNLSDGNPLAAGGPQIARIPINSNRGEVIYYTDPSPQHFFDCFVGSKFDILDLYLTLGSEQDQRPLDCKGVPWSVKLGFLAYRSATTDLRLKPAKRPFNMLK